MSYLITLRATNAKGPSLLNRRLISLHPGETTVLGRLSKNHKMEYIAKSTNGYFENPIISRCHAVLENRSGHVIPPAIPFPDIPFLPSILGETNIPQTRESLVTELTVDIHLG